MESPVDGLIRVRAVEAARVALIELLAPAVVCIFPKGARTGGGSGVVISADGVGLTNYHVVASFGEDRMGQGGTADGELRPLEVLGLDPTGDVAVFKLHGDPPFPFAELGDSDSLAVGQPAIAMGNPFLLAEDYTPTVTLGVISGLHRYQGGARRSLIYTDCIQVDTSINPGNSGGPLFNGAGRIVGINGRIGAEERSRVNVGVGFAISSNQIRRFLPALRAGLVVPHGSLGATAFDAARGGVVVDQILESSAAYRAGLRLRDRVLRLNGRDIASANQLLNLLGTYPAEWPVTLEVERAGEAFSLRFRLDPPPLPERPGRPQRPDGQPARVAAPQPIDGPNEPANIAEVRRLLRLCVESFGGPDATAAVGGWTVTVRRVPAGGGAAVTTRETETRGASRALEDAEARPAPAALETAVRWALLEPPAVRPSQWRFVRGDLAGDRVAGVVAWTLESGRRVELAFDDVDGTLLRVEFDDPTSGRTSFEYDDYRRVGPLRLPHRRTLVVAGRPFAEDTIVSYDLAPRRGGAPDKEADRR